MDLEKLQGTWRSCAATHHRANGRVERNEPATLKAFALHFETGPEAGNTNYGI